MKILQLFIFSCLQVGTRSQNVGITTDGLAAQTSYNTNPLETNPFLSATLPTTISYNQDTTTLPPASPFHLDFDSTRKSTFSNTLSKFLTKIFNDQKAYELRVISVSIFDDHIIQGGEFDMQQEQYYQGTDRSGASQNTFAFSMVVSAEYTNESQIGTITNRDFSDMLVHICHKFQSHLMEYMQETRDPYFMEVESIVVGEFQKTIDYEEQNTQYLVLGMPSDQLHSASIIAIVVGGIVFIAFSFVSFKLYRYVR